MDINFINNFPKKLQPQHQNKQPGIESLMNPLPIYDDESYIPSNKLKDKVVLITGGDSGIGRAISVLFAKEGAKVAISYLDEEDDAVETKNIIEKYNGQCALFPGDIGEENVCNNVVEETIKSLGKIDILINNAAEQHIQQKIEDITKEQLERTFKTNLFSMFYMTKAALKYIQPGGNIINTTSITAYEGHKTLIDYSCTKGAIVTFTRSMALSLQDKQIRVNAVAPGPIWTPLIPASFNESEVGQFGSNSPSKRPGQPVELAGAYLYLASDLSSYVSGEIIHVNGGTIING